MKSQKTSKQTSPDIIIRPPDEESYCTQDGQSY